jgi:triacylglycerol esterase/lipase EstA (alpha/beta hydrolase family)
VRDLVHREDERFALIRRADKPLEKLAIFVHGFRGNYWTTWGPLGHLLHTEADSKPIYEEWDFLFLGYDTADVATFLDIAQLIWSQWRKAERGNPPYNHPYKKVALIGHSLGTLGIRQALCAHTQQPPGMLSALHGVIYFGSPLNGSPWAKVARHFWKIGVALEAGSPQLRMLKAWTQDIHGYAPWPDARLVTGLDDQVVGYTAGELIEWTGDEPPSLTQTDHSGLVKPKGWDTMVIDYITACLQ